MLTKMVSIELAGLNAISIHPGWVKTDMGGEQAPLEPEQSAAGIVNVIDHFDAKTQNGSFLQYDGSVLKW